MSVRAKALSVAVAAMSLFAFMQLLSSAASASDQTPTQRVIVVFKNQDAGQPATRADIGARKNSFHSTQSPVLSQLSASGLRSTRPTP